MFQALFTPKGLDNTAQGRRFAHPGFTMPHTFLASSGNAPNAFSSA